MLKKTVVGSSIVALMFIVGCGGGSSSPVSVTKVLFDGPIVGAGYVCSPSAPEEKKITDSEGKFTCLKGDTATFYIGNYELGEVTVEDDGENLLEIDEIVENEAAATDLKQLLQSLDTDKEDSVTTIPENFDALNDVNASPGDDNFDDVVGSVVEEETGEEFVDEATANKNADEDKQKYLLAGKTFYYVSHKTDTPVVIEVRFDENLSKLESFKDTVSIGDNILDLNGSEITMHGTVAIIFTAKEKDGNVWITAKKPGENSFDVRLYTKLSDAEKQYDEETAGDTDFKVLLAGKTFYFVSKDGMSKTVINTAFTETVMTDYNPDGTTEAPETNSVEIEGDKLIINDSGDYLKFISDKGDYLEFDLFDSSDKSEGKVRAYKDQTKAEAYLATLGGGSEVSTGCHEDGDALTVDEGKTCEFKGHTAVCNSGSITVDNMLTSGQTVSLNELSFSCSGSSDDTRLYVKPTTVAEARAMIVGTWSRGCEDRGEGSYRIKLRKYTADGHAEQIKTYYTDAACTVLDTSREPNPSYFTFDYTLGEEITGSKGEDAYTWDTSSMYWMIRFDERGIYFTDITNERDGTSPETRANYFYPDSSPYIKVSEDAKIDSESQEADTVITEAMLENRIFYIKYMGGEYTEYMKAEFTDGNYVGTKVTVNNETGEAESEVGSFPYVIIDGKIRVNISDDNNYVWEELTSQNDTQWNLQLSIDEGKNGTIDKRMSDTWYLSKPSDFPNFL